MNVRSHWKLILKALLLIVPALLALIAISDHWDYSARLNFFNWGSSKEPSPLEDSEPLPALDYFPDLDIGTEPTVMENQVLEPGYLEMEVVPKQVFSELSSNSGQLLEQIKQDELERLSAVKDYQEQIAVYQDMIYLFKEKNSPLVPEVSKAKEYAENAYQASLQGDLETAHYWSLAANIQVYIIAKRSNNLAKRVRFEQALNYTLQALETDIPGASKYWALAASLQTLTGLKTKDAVIRAYTLAVSYAEKAAQSFGRNELMATQYWEKAALYQQQAGWYLEKDRHTIAADYKQLGFYLSKAAMTADPTSSNNRRNWMSSEVLSDKAQTILKKNHPDLAYDLTEPPPPNIPVDDKKIILQAWLWAADYRAGVILTREAGRLDLAKSLAAAEQRALRVTTIYQDKEVQPYLGNLTNYHRRAIIALRNGEIGLALAFEEAAKYSIIAAEGALLDQQTSSYWSQVASYQYQAALAQMQDRKDVAIKFKQAVQYASEAALAFVPDEPLTATQWNQAAECISLAATAIQKDKLSLANTFTQASNYAVKAAVSSTRGKLLTSKRWHWMSSSTRLSALAARDGNMKLAKEFELVTSYAEKANAALAHNHKEEAHYWSWATNNQKNAAIATRDRSNFAIKEYRQAAQFAVKAATDAQKGHTDTARRWGDAAVLMMEAIKALKAQKQTEASHLQKRAMLIAKKITANQNGR